jgi:transcriptional regulator with XRE-family HTH domain
MKRETSLETIQRVLSSYELGRKLRQLRLRKKIALVDLAKHTGLSPSMLSQLETGKMIPTLPTLARIAMVFDVGMEHFFTEKRGTKLFAVVRAKERMRFPEKPEVSNPSYFFECLTFATQGKGLQAYLAEFPPRAPGKQSEHLHDGLEFLFILEGALNIRYQEEDHELHAGDSLLLDASAPHHYHGAGKNGARAVVVTVASRV